MPPLARMTVLPSFVGSYVMPKRGCHMFLSDGIVPSDGNSCPYDVFPMKGAKKTWSGGVMGSGSICASQRRPKLIVRFGSGCHLSWMKTAGSSWTMLCVPAWSIVRPGPGTCWRYRTTGPVIVVPAGQLPVVFDVPSEHSTYWLFFVKFRNPLTEPKMIRPFAKPRNVCVAFVRLYSTPPLIVWFPVRNVTFSLNCRRVS